MRACVVYFKDAVKQYSINYARATENVNVKCCWAYYVRREFVY